MAKQSPGKIRKEALEKIAKIQQYLDSGMCPEKDREHFQERIKKLMPQVYGTSEK